jgi:enediyne biosynthesis protein E4
MLWCASGKGHKRRASAVIAIAALGAPDLSAQIAVVDATESAGLTTNHMPDIPCLTIGQWWMTGGLAIGDFNRDNWPDVFVIGGGQTPDKLFINNGDGTFTNQAPQWGVSALHGGNGAAVGDFNRDGWPDLYVTSFGTPGQTGQPGKHRLYKNNGNGTFTEMAVAAGVNYTTTTTFPSGYGGCFGDYDLDGDLDLFVANWKDQSSSGNGGTGNRLFRNNGNSTFTDATPIAIPLGLQAVWGFQGAFVDMNGDHFPELLVAADFKSSRYLINNGNGTFTNFTTASGTGKDDNGMGQTVGDFNRDGLLDWYVTSIHKDNPLPGNNPGNMLYTNQGNHVYVENSIPAGVNDGGWGWGTVAVDLDNDGWDEIVEVNGRQGGSEWENELEYIYQNDSDGTFTRLPPTCGLTLAGEGRGLAWFDADRDGDQDFVITVNNGALRYYRNDTPNQGNWLRVVLSTQANPHLPPDGFGALVKVTAGEITWHRYMSGSPSYLATSEQSLHFGLGQIKAIDSLEVHWPRGQITTISNPVMNAFLTINAPIPADINANGSVNVDDLLAVINAWGPCPGVCAADTNASGAVDVDDLLEVINNWG